MLTAPASQAFVERLFSVSGMLSCGRRNRKEKSLEMRVMFCMRLNKGRRRILFMQQLKYTQMTAADKLSE